MAPRKNTNAAASSTPAAVETAPVVVEAAPVVVEAPPAPEIVDANEAVEAVEVVAESAVTTLTDRFGAINAKIALLQNLQKEYNLHIKDIQSALKTVQKEVAVLQKNLAKKRGGRKAAATGGDATSNGVEKKLSGFSKPALLSPELCEFLGKPNGESVPRTQVTKLITKYISDNKLYNDDDKRKIIPNDALIKLLNITPGDTLTYFNLQKHMKHHFIKLDPPVDTPAPAVAVATA